MSTCRNDSGQLKSALIYTCHYSVTMVCLSVVNWLGLDSRPCSGLRLKRHPELFNVLLVSQNANSSQSHGHRSDDRWHHAGELVGKPVSFFVSTASQGGGQETTIMTALTQAVHHGMIYVPPGYTHGAPMYDLSEVRGGSPWGAGCFAGADGSRQPSAAELAYAKHQGEYFAGKALKIAA